MECDIARFCEQCRRSLINNKDVSDKCTKWLAHCNISNYSEKGDNISCLSCSEQDVISETNSDKFSDNRAVITHKDNIKDCLENKIISENKEDLFLNITANNIPNSYKNIKIINSQNVHIGNITHIHGSVVVNQIASTINQNIIINNNRNNTAKIFPVVPRRTWLAQPPVDPEDVQYFPETPKYVIINHSASEEAFTQTENNLLVRLIQQFHIESLKWNDIAYNFLVGADGTIYEGRGWNVIGAHTLGYNYSAIGICFIGCYMKTLPPAEVLKKVQKFIKYGVEIGAIVEDYSVLAHCQCRSSENPGNRLFEEIKTWDRWNEKNVSNKDSLL